jgi:sulfur-oxidizing protein SoxX
MKKMNSKLRTGLAVASVALLAVGCASAPSVADLNALTQQIVKASFRDEGIVKASILNTDETNQVCSEADASGKPLDEKTAKRIEEINMKAIKWPSDGKFIGDWKEGEKIAQNGRGLTFTTARFAASPTPTVLPPSPSLNIPGAKFGIQKPITLAPTCHVQATVAS